MLNSAYTDISSFYSAEVNTRDIKVLYLQQRVHLVVLVSHLPFPATGTHSCSCGPKPISNLQLYISVGSGRLPTEESQLTGTFSNSFTSDIPPCFIPHCVGSHYRAEFLCSPQLRLKNPDHLASLADGDIRAAAAKSRDAEFKKMEKKWAIIELWYVTTFGGQVNFSFCCYNFMNIWFVLSSTNAM